MKNKKATLCGRQQLNTDSQFDMFRWHLEMNIDHVMSHTSELSFDMITSTSTRRDWEEKNVNPMVSLQKAGSKHWSNFWYWYRI